MESIISIIITAGILGCFACIFILVVAAYIIAVKAVHRAGLINETTRREWLE